MEKKTHLFKAEIREMLDLVVNSLYSKKEIFLRELISNASDAIDRAKYQGLTDASLLADNPEWKIEITMDAASSTLMISDNGSGMDAEDMEKNLGVIANSGTKAFRKALDEKGGANLPELIGQFGVGFYAAFMVADSVRVVSKKRGGDAAYSWESDCGGSYTIGEGERDGYGTSVMLHLREEHAKTFLDKWKIGDLVREYSDFIQYPIYFKDLGKKDGEKKEGEEEAPKPLNTMKAIWKRPKKEVTEKEYAEFYKHLSRDWQDPFETIHFSGEGAVEFKALVFIPKTAERDLYVPNSKHGLSLYVRNVFIGDEMEMLLPEYLRFVKGVVDSADLPLNVSREMLQDDAVISKIKQAVTSKILSTLSDMKEKDEARYLEFHNTFARFVKEGLVRDYQNAERIKKLLYFRSAKSEDGKYISLSEYVKNMPEGQSDIYYLAADRIEDARSSPQIEKALKHGCDVLFFLDPIDEWITENFGTFEGKKLVDVARGEVSFGTEEDRKAEKESNEKASAELKPFLDSVKEQLKDKVSEVRVSTRLADSPCCLVADANAISPQMERIYRAMNQEVPQSLRILEVNAEHPLVKKMSGMEGQDLADAVDLLHSQALIAEGSPIPDPARFAKLLTALMLK